MSTTNKRTRGLNKYVYKFHFVGTLNGIAIDEKHTSMRGFLEKYGGTATPLNLNRQKVYRLMNGFYENKRPSVRSRKINLIWNLKVERIFEVRPYKRIALEKVLVDELPESPVGADSFNKNVQEATVAIDQLTGDLIKVID